MKNNDFLTVLLASLVDRLKAKNPKIWAIVAAVLIGAFAGLEYAETVFTEMPDWVFNVLQILNAVILALTGSRTSKILAEEAENKSLGNATPEPTVEEEG